MDDPLEAKLKRALARTEPSEGFAERVMARVAQAAAQPQSARRRWPLYDWLPVLAWRHALAGALVCLLLLTAGVAYREHSLRIRAEQERRQAEQARAQLMLALEITGAQLSRARQIVLKRIDFRQARENIRQ
jgi:hypothetical protein